MPLRLREYATACGVFVPQVHKMSASEGILVRSSDVCISLPNFVEHKYFSIANSLVNPNPDPMRTRTHTIPGLAPVTTPIGPHRFIIGTAALEAAVRRPRAYRPAAHLAALDGKHGYISGFAGFARKPLQPCCTARNASTRMVCLEELRRLSKARWNDWMTS